MVSLGVVNYKADIGVVITASHDLHHITVIKIKGDFGGPLLPKDILLLRVRYLNLTQLILTQYVLNI